MNDFRRLNNLIGWVVFLIALCTYALTVERTASFWDCGEFIASAFKLQVPHPPGAPLFLLLGRLFSLFAMGNVSQVAYWVNMLSVVSSAFTILFLFFTISLLSRKLIAKEDHALTSVERTLVLGASLVGALAYTWSDSFWFSAVEAEVYALSSFFTAALIWAVFRWERLEPGAASNRWLLLIAYLVGLSIGVHLLNLVTIPALALVFYFKHSVKPGFWGSVAAVLTGMFVLIVIDSGIIPGLPSLAGKFEIFFVNSLGLPFRSGMISFVFLFIVALAWAIRRSQIRQKSLLNTVLLSFTFVLIGYSSYLLVLVRSNYNPPINENNPSDFLSFISYLKREQYGSRPLLYGPSFSARPISQKHGSPVYKKSGNQYAVIDHRPEYVYEPGSEMLLPRLWSSQPGQPQLYSQMTGVQEGQRPTMFQNLSFMFSHQLGHMYWRYFLWNFAGRESDREGAGVLLPWDQLKTFPSIVRQNRGHDNYFMLPFVLGLLGIIALYFKSKRDLLVLSMLFLLTGVALAFYLNSPPAEPRERDYIYVGSFYIFCIWVGLGVFTLADAIKVITVRAQVSSALAVVCGFIVPVVLVARGWDNHDRSNRYHSVDFARNLLSSCAPNAILFTGGDNDTFPLWYVQEVEGFRTDVRVCVQTYLGIDWYIEQLKRRINTSDALTLSLDSNSYTTGKNEYLPFYEVPGVKDGINLKEFLELVKLEHKAIQVPLTSGDMTSILPSSVLFLPVNVAAVQNMNVVRKDLMPFVTNSMSWTIGKADLSKSDLVMLDIIATNDWKRPVYFSSTMGDSHNLGLKEYLQLEGYAYRLLPVKVPGATEGYVNTDIMYDNVMNKMTWRELNNPKTYYDDTYLGAPVASGRIAFLRLANQLLDEEKVEKAKKVVDKALTVMPDDTIPFDQFSTGFVSLLFELGDSKRALDTAMTMALRADENLTFAENSNRFRGRNANVDLFILQSLTQSCRSAKEELAAMKYETMLQKHLAARQRY